MGKRRGLRVLLPAALLALLLCDSRWHLQVTEYTLVYERLPAAFDGFRIVQLSDLHGAVFGPGNRRLVRAVAEQEPDLIALTGDMAGGVEELDALEDLLQGLRGLAPIYSVSGNHEWAGGVMGQVRALLEDAGAHSLENRWERLERGGAYILIAGVDDPMGRADQIRPDRLAQQIRQAEPDAFLLWLGHRNDWVTRYGALPVQLILSGHAHGGIVRLPGIGGLLDKDRSLFARYEAGVYASGGYRMVVSRGLGSSAAIPRLFNRPEIVTVVLRSGQA